MSFCFDDARHYTEGTPFHEFARLRTQAPFAWTLRSRTPGSGFWLAMKHRDVVAISKNPAQFATNAPLLQDPLPAEAWSDFPAAAMIANNLLTFDHRKHPAARSLISTLLAPAKIAHMEDAIRALCIEFLGEAIKHERLDFAQRVALPFPAAVVLGLVLGIPRADQQRLTRTVLAINAMEDPRFCTPPGGMMGAAEELYTYGMAHLDQLQRSPGGSVLGEMLNSAQAEVSKEALFLAYWFPLTAGAFDTTAATIAGGVRALLSFPEQAERLRNNPSLIPAAVEEMFRWVSPVIYFRRNATSDTMVAGQRVRKGDTIVLCYASANRDEDVFPSPEIFDLAREPNDHVSFGYGPHYCVGAALARSMTRIFLEEFLAYLQDFELDGNAIHTRSGWMNRIWSMPLLNRRPA